MRSSAAAVVRRILRVFPRYVMHYYVYLSGRSDKQVAQLIAWVVRTPCEGTLAQPAHDWLCTAERQNYY